MLPQEKQMLALCGIAVCIYGRTRRNIMKKYSDMSKEELLTLKAQLDKEFADIKAQGLALDMSRGKPAADQLNLSMELMY